MEAMYSLIKRIIDILFSAIGLVLLFPLFLYISLRIKLDSRGPIFYRGERVGKDGIPFEIIKFRSMAVDADKIECPPTPVLEDDTRVTPIGKWLRKYKLDELPQVINVLKGEMSLVGSRPEAESWVKTYEPESNVIFAVKPGITDLASIEFRNEGEIIAKSGIEDPHDAYRDLILPKKLKLQREYVQNQSLLLDIKIIIKTILAIVKDKKKYI